MKQPSIFLLSFLSFGLALLLPSASPGGEAKGFAVVRPTNLTGFQNADCVEFTSIEIHPYAVRVGLPNDSSIGYKRDLVGDLVYYFEFSRQPVVTETQVLLLRQHREKFAKYPEKYSKSKKLVAEELERVDEALQRFEGGMRLFKGQWISESQLENMEDFSSVHGLESFTLKGRTYLNVAAVAQEGLQVKIRHSGGVTSMSVEDLSEEQVLDLNRVSGAVLIQKFDLTAMRLEAEQKASAKRNEAVRLRELMRESAKKAMAEAQNESEQLQQKAEKKKGEISQSLRDRISLKEKQIKEIQGRIQHDTKGDEEFRMLYESFRRAGQELEFVVSMRISKDSMPVTKSFPGDSAFLITLPGDILGLLCGAANIFQSQGEQNRYLRQVGVTQYESDSGFVQTVPIFVPSDPADVLMLKKVLEQINLLDGKSLRMQEELAQLRDEIGKLQTALEDPKLNREYKDYLALLDQAEQVVRKAEEKISESLGESDTIEMREIKTLEEEAGAIMAGFEEVKAELEATRIR